MLRFLWLFFATVPIPLTAAHAAEAAPWGTSAPVEVEYRGQKVVYDVAADTLKTFTGVLDRASYLSNLNGGNPLTSSIVLVLHGPEIDYFALKNFARHQTLMERAQSLTVGEVIKFRICRAAAESRGWKPSDLHGFVELVPMGDAEIVRLQQEEGHAYMR